MEKISDANPSPVTLYLKINPSNDTPFDDSPVKFWPDYQGSVRVGSGLKTRMSDDNKTILIQIDG